MSLWVCSTNHTPEAYRCRGSAQHLQQSSGQQRHLISGPPPLSLHRPFQFMRTSFFSFFKLVALFLLCDQTRLVLSNNLCCCAVPKASCRPPSTSSTPTRSLLTCYHHRTGCLCSRDVDLDQPCFYFRSVGCVEWSPGST